MFERSQLAQLKKRLSKPRKFIQVILGPRQVGKTTLAEQLSRKLDIEHLFVSTDAVPPSNSLWIEQQWETARIKVKSSLAKQFLLIIDEIQKIQNWSEVVKKNWDADTRNKTNIKVLLLGSSSFSIQSGLTESQNRLELWGRRVEQAVGSYLLNQSRINAFDLYYWREGNDEVDFILKRNKKIIALEVKTTRIKFHAGVDKFNKKYKPYKNILISSESLSWSDFLLLDLNSLFN